jgi:uncharacterized protein YecT (DUF1311 family)
MDRMKQLNWLAATILGISSSGALIGQVNREVDRRLSESYWQCMSAQSGPVQIAACNKRELRLRDTALNSTYRAVMRRLSPPARHELRFRERKWIRQRDRICRKRTEIYAGALAEANLSHCLLQETVMRTIWLESLYAKDLI